MIRAFIISLAAGVLALLYSRTEDTAVGDMIGALASKVGLAVTYGVALYMVGYLAYIKWGGKETVKAHNERSAKRKRDWVFGGGAAFVVLAFGAHYAPI